MPLDVVLSYGVPSYADDRQNLPTNTLAMHRLFFTALLVTGLIGCTPSETVSTTSDKAQFVFVRIPEQIQPLERGAKYEKPLDIALKKEGVGEVSGGGSQLSGPDADGKRSIEWVGVDVDLSDFDKGMPILKRELSRLGAPSDTVLEYTRDGKVVEQKLR